MGLLIVHSCDGMFYKIKIVVVVVDGEIPAVSDAALLSQLLRKSSLFIVKIHYVQRKST